MSMERRKSYEGRWWALNTDEHGVTASVHHFSSKEVRDGWVAMDPGLRKAVDQGHPEVRRWLAEDPNYTPTRWEQISIAWLSFWKWIANIGRRSI